MTYDDPATASDALSLHTIADEADAYTAQEQEDADFALALRLEDEETQQLIASSDAQEQAQSGIDAVPLDDPPPYRDEADTEDQDLANLPPYRDDPEAAPTTTTDDEALPPPVPNLLPRLLRTFRTIRRLWLCGVCIFSVSTFVIILVIVLLLAVFGKRIVDPRETAWKASNSRDNDLKLPALYPQLEDGASAECNRIWKRYGASLQCHRMILSPDWDNSDVKEAKRNGVDHVDPFGYSDEICTATCRDSIENLRNPTYNGCSRRTDRYNLTSYGEDGKMYFDKETLEEGPRLSYFGLLKRYDHICAKVPRKMTKGKTWGPSEYGTCTADLWMRWGILDGVNARDLKTVDSFIAQTNEKKTIEGGLKIGSIDLVGGRKKDYNIFVKSMEVGPGLGETECEFCTLEWLEKTMLSFEYGKFLDPETGTPLGLQEFWDKTYKAITRCDPHWANGVLERVYERWRDLGWICGQKSKLCHPDPTKLQLDAARSVLYGPSPETDELLNRVHSRIDALEKYVKDTHMATLHMLYDSLKNLPCAHWLMWLKPEAFEFVVPKQYMVQNICSDKCRNAMDRLHDQHGEAFIAAEKELPFRAWSGLREEHNRTCLSTSNSGVVTSRTSFCAPGYAALGHLDWLWKSEATRPGIRPHIVKAFSAGVDKIANNISKYPQTVPKDPVRLATLGRQVAESVCNTCTSELLIGRNPRWKETTNEFYDDEEVDGKEYQQVARKYVTTCFRMMGHPLNWQHEKEVWRGLGLDRY